MRLEKQYLRVGSNLNKGHQNLKTNKVIALTILPLFIPLIFFIGSANAITGNYTVDQTPYAGVVVLFADQGRTQPIGYCSGFLISPTVMVTAGHSIVNAVAVSVCFDQGPISYTIENGQIMYDGVHAVYNGVPKLFSGYYPSLAGNQEYRTSDVGAIVLDEPVKEVTEFARLPTPGLTDSFQAKTDLKVVGYGMQTQITPKNGGPQNSWVGTVTRCSAKVQLLSSNFCSSDLYLKLTANPSQDKGSISFGDSGGPVICSLNGENVAVAINAFVSSSNCNGVSYHTRLDVAPVLDWINELQ